MSKIGDGERPTMGMVATLAGVSTITVSRALRGSDLVRPEVRKRIVQIANQVGYRMNVAARSLRTRESRTIVQALHAAGARASFVELSSPFGHDAFLLDSPEMNRVIDGFLRTGR